MWALATLAGLAMLCCALAEVGPPALSGIGAVVVAASYTSALSLRSGGRPVVYGALAVLMGVSALWSDEDFLRSGAAVLTAIVSGVFAVVATIPAVRFAHAVREVLVAVLIAAGGALAVVGLEPEVALGRFEYTTLAGGLALALLIVYRLGAGLNGLGRRGVAGVVVGGLALAGTLAYAEALRRYGPPGLVDTIDSAVGWTRSQLGAVPQPLQVLVGVPALAWGAHLRARRRQGWWVSVFGVAATTSVTVGLLHPNDSVAESVLAVGYSVALGLLIGYAVIRADLALTAPRGARGRRAEEATASRPESGRLTPLL